MDKNVFKRMGIELNEIDSAEKVELAPGETVKLQIPREAIERGRIESYLREFANYDNKKDMRGCLQLSFEGYDSDPREVFEIKEIRDWLSRILSSVPHLFYFLSSENDNMQIAFSCIVPITLTADGRAGYTSTAAKSTIEKISRNAVAYAKKKKDSAAVQYALAEAILSETGYEHL
ncbi:hypothetical protein [Gorillibacterium massiliense]|uniref:hypothetical protein n=1 Tax=Gorillibacterium massiliense TaxID=1280390 RepID=UPI0004B83050|nr:hypothetical protein [Gorillibacterium massiliense]